MQPRPDLSEFLARLTPRERQISAYVAAGSPNKVIAIDLGISLRTAEAHRARIFAKLQVRNAMQLACRLCAHARMLEPPGPAQPDATQPDVMRFGVAPPANPSSLSAMRLHEPVARGYAARGCSRPGAATSTDAAESHGDGAPAPGRARSADGKNARTNIEAGAEANPRAGARAPQRAAPWRTLPRSRP